MIAAENRSVLTEALTPPPGYLFDHGIATTYSLDLVTLLGLPLHLAWLGNLQDNGGELDLIAVMEALRRTSGQLTIFHQSGHMHAPRTHSPLFSLLEEMVHEVTAPHGGAFHPKVWLLRFTSSAEAPILRLLVLSRNLTDDRSWDISLSLDGVIGRKIVAENKPLCAMLESTIKRGQRLDEMRARQAKSLLADALRTVWELPAGFDELRFHALGVGKQKRPWQPLPDAGYWDTLGVISPFVRPQALQLLAESSTERPFLITRADELDVLPADAISGFSTPWVMDAGAEDGDTEEAVDGRQRGLHAKVYVGKRGWNTHLFVGSANASDAALVDGINVEFMVELIGRASKVGTPADWLGEKGLGPLLLPYMRTEPDESNSELKQMQRLEQVRDQLCSASLTLRCEVVDGGWAVRLTGLDQVELGEVSGWTWPASVKKEAAIAIPGRAPLLHLGVFAAQDICAFTGFLLKLGQSTLPFALSLPLIGAPADREMELLRAVLRNRDGFVRYLLLLLGDWEPDGGSGGGGGAGGAGKTSAAPPLFEMMARAYARDPARLAHIEQVVARLRKEGEADADVMLSAEFLGIWKNFEAALKGRKQ